MSRGFIKKKVSVPLLEGSFASNSSGKAVAFV